MCTALNKTIGQFHYFGRNLDLNYEYDESIIVVGRKYPLKFKKIDNIDQHYAIYGVGIKHDNYPFFFDCCNEKGLSFAGLNFPGFAKFNSPQENKINLAPYELPLYLLAKYSSIKDIKKDLEVLNIIDIPYDEHFPVATLHFILADKNECIVLEQTKDGLKIYPNPYGVLTNNPTFDFHVLNLSNYLNITNQEVNNIFLKDFDLTIFGKGLQGRGLPGDSSPCSRFIKATFLLNNIHYDDDYDRNLSQMMHVLNNVSTLVGEVKQSDGSNEYTIYSSMYETTTSTLFLRTYHHYAILKYNLDLNNVDNDDINVINIPKDIIYQNIK